MKNKGQTACAVFPDKSSHKQMSGKATTLETRRINQEEFLRLRYEIGEFLTKTGIRFIPVTSLSGKTTHGDIDIVVAEEDWMEHQKPCKEPNTKGLNHGGNIEFPEGVTGSQSRTGFTHVAWPVGDGTHVQVDFIRTPGKHLKQTQTYLSHGTLGNTIGLVCRSIGLRYKMIGLHMIARHPNGQKCGSIEIETDPEKCLRILQFPEEDIQRILHGSFHDREDYYPVPTRLPFFHTDCIHPERMTAPNRGRDKKRPEITPYREWLLTQGIVQNWELPDRDDQEAYLRYQKTWIIRLLGEGRYQELLNQQTEISNQLRSKLGPKQGKRIWFEQVAELTGTTPEKIGPLVQQTAGGEKMNTADFIDQNSPEEAAEKIKNHKEQSGEDTPEPFRILAYKQDKVVPAKPKNREQTLSWMIGKTPTPADENGLPGKDPKTNEETRLYIASMGQVFKMTGAFLEENACNRHCAENAKAGVIGTTKNGVILCAENAPAIPILPEFAGYKIP